MDTSSELIHSLLLVFLVSVLGASMTSVGLIEGVAEATAPITKIFSGYFSLAVLPPNMLSTSIRSPGMFWSASKPPEDPASTVR
jgi:hypothetical protein